MLDEAVQHQINLGHVALLTAGRIDLLFGFLGLTLQRHFGPIDLTFADLGAGSQAAILQVDHGALHNTELLEDPRVVLSGQRCL